MRSRLIVAVAGALSCTCVLAGAPTLSLADYMAAKHRLTVELLDANKACNSQPSERRDICMVDVMGKDWVAKADLEVAYRSLPRSRAEASLARVDARFWLDRERCDAGVQQDKAVCLQKANTVRVAGRAGVAEQLKAEERTARCAGHVAGDAYSAPACGTAVEARRPTSR